MNERTNQHLNRLRDIVLRVERNLSSVFEKTRCAVSATLKLSGKIISNAFRRSPEIIDEVWYRAYFVVGRNAFGFNDKLTKSDVASIEANARKYLSQNGIRSVKKIHLAKYELKTIQSGMFRLSKEYSGPLTGINRMGENAIESAREMGKSEVRAASDAVNQAMDEIYCWALKATKALRTVSEEHRADLDSIISDADALYSQVIGLNCIGYSPEQLRSIQAQFYKNCDKFDQALKKAKDTEAVNHEIHE